MKNQNLYNFNDELEQWKIRGSILLFLNRSKIADFYNHNSHKIDKLNKDLLDIHKRYFEYENSEGRDQFIFEGVGKDKKPKMIEGKLMEDFNKEVNELMQQDCDIKF